MMKKIKYMLIVVLSILLMLGSISNRNNHIVTAKTTKVHPVESYDKHLIPCDCGNGELVILETTINDNKSWYLLNSTCDCVKCTKDSFGCDISTYFIPCKCNVSSNYHVVLKINTYDPYDVCILKTDQKSKKGYNIVDIGELLHIRNLGIYGVEISMLKDDQN